MKIDLFNPEFNNLNFHFEKQYYASDLSFIKLLESNDDFFVLISKLRDKYKVPSGGFNPINIKSKRFLCKIKPTDNIYQVDWEEFCHHYIDYKTTYTESDVFLDIENLIQKYNLHDRWINPFYFYIFFNKMPSPVTDVIEIYSGKQLQEGISSTDSLTGHPEWAIEENSVYICLKAKFTKADLHKLIDLHYDEISEQTRSRKYFNKITSADLDIHRFIYNNRTGTKKLTYSEIAEELHKKYGVSYNDEDIRNKFAYYKKHILPRLKHVRND